MRKEDRQTLIKQLVLDNDVATQEELLDLLKAEGVSATQATISRDINELNLIKTPTSDGGTKYDLYQPTGDNESQLEKSLMETVEFVTQVEFLTIIKTLPGNADVIAALYDQLDFPEVVATLAGHDTLVLISHNNEEAEKLARSIEALMDEREE